MGKLARVECVFYCRPTWTLRELALPTSSAPQDHGFRLCCQDYAWENGFTHWVQPDSVADPTCWHVFESRGRYVRLFLRSAPTREAAMAWLVHCGSN